jgi:hypothetical protein
MTSTALPLSLVSQSNACDVFSLPHSFEGDEHGVDDLAACRTAELGYCLIGVTADVSRLQTATAVNDPAEGQR